MKNKIISTIVALSVVGTSYAIEVNDNLSINGFVDTSYSNAKTDGSATNTEKVSIDEVELNFLFNVGSVSGEIHLDNDNTDSTDGNQADIEQAHFTYQINGAVSATFGRYGSALGFEREDPAGLYTFSRAYTDDSFNLGDVDNNRVEGLTLAYSADSYTIAVSLANQVGVEADLQDNDLDFEISFTYAGIAGVNIGGGFFIDNEDTGTAQTDSVNLHISRQFGKLLLAGEYTQLDTDANGQVGEVTEEQDAYMILADYDFNDKFGIAVRLSSQEQSGITADYDKVTIAPNYAITDSLGAIFEYSDVDNAGTDSEELAVELTYTF